MKLALYVIKSDKLALPLIGPPNLTDNNIRAEYTCTDHGGYNVDDYLDCIKDGDIIWVTSIDEAKQFGIMYDIPVVCELEDYMLPVNFYMNYFKEDGYIYK